MPMTLMPSSSLLKTNNSVPFSTSDISGCIPLRDGLSTYFSMRLKTNPMDLHIKANDEPATAAKQMKYMKIVVSFILTTQ